MGAAAPQMSGGREGRQEDRTGGLSPVNMELQNAVRCNDLLMIQDMVQAKVTTPDVALCKVYPPQNLPLRLPFPSTTPTSLMHHMFVPRTHPQLWGRRLACRMTCRQP
jgi:hypothetical protein